MLTGPSLEATSGKADSLVIFCHGYGSNGDDLITLGKNWQVILPNTAFISPNAPEESPNPGGYQWFPKTSFTSEERIKGSYAASACLDEFIDASLKKYSVKPERLALVGFSQGTMMALHVGLRRNKGLAGILGYSGALAAPGNLVKEMKCKVPILLVHGAQDNVIPFPALFEAVGALEAAGLKPEKHISQNTAHGIAQDGMQMGGTFLARIFG